MQVKSECVDVIDGSEVIFFLKYYSEVWEVFVHIPAGLECHLNLKFYRVLLFFRFFFSVLMGFFLFAFCNQLFYEYLDPFKQIIKNQRKLGLKGENKGCVVSELKLT